MEHFECIKRLIDVRLALTAKPKWRYHFLSVDVLVLDMIHFITILDNNHGTPPLLFIYLSIPTLMCGNGYRAVARNTPNIRSFSFHIQLSSPIRPITISI